VYFFGAENLNKKRFVLCGDPGVQQPGIIHTCMLYMPLCLSGGGQSVLAGGVQWMWISSALMSSRMAWRLAGVWSRQHLYSNTLRIHRSLHCHLDADTLSSAQEQNQGGHRSETRQCRLCTKTCTMSKCATL
jgi:hypothetical protein